MIFEYYACHFEATWPRIKITCACIQMIYAWYLEKDFFRSSYKLVWWLLRKKQRRLLMLWSRCQRSGSQKLGTGHLIQHKIFSMPRPTITQIGVVVTLVERWQNKVWGRQVNGKGDRDVYHDFRFRLISWERFHLWSCKLICWLLGK